MNRRKSSGLEAIALNSELFSTPKGFKTRTVIQKPVAARIREKRRSQVLQKSNKHPVSRELQCDVDDDLSWQNIPENDSALDSFEPDDVVFLQQTQVFDFIHTWIV
jgi:hypothetical protein